MKNESNVPPNQPEREVKGAGAKNDAPQKPAKITTRRIPTLPELRERAMGAIQRFKESQRLPIISRLMDKKNPPTDVPPDGMDFANFYRL